MSSSSSVPRPGRRSRRQSARTRLTILAAAEAVFAREGLAGARTAAIARESGVTKAMLYYYFQSKEALYQAAIEERFAGFSRRSVALLTQPGPAGELLLRYVELHFDWMCLNYRSARLYQQLMGSQGPLARQLIKKYFSARSRAVGALLKRGMEEGVFRRADIFQTAMSLISLIAFYFSAAPTVELMGFHDAYSPATLQLRKRELVSFIRHALFANPTASDS